MKKLEPSTFIAIKIKQKKNPLNRQNQTKLDKTEINEKNVK